jgi:hypothetical protein
MSREERLQRLKQLRAKANEMINEGEAVEVAD